MNATRSDRIAACLVATCAAAPVACLAIGAGGGLRYVTRLPLGICCALAAAAVIVMAGLWVASVARRLSPRNLAVCVVTLAVGVALLGRRLWTPELSGMVTIGGGDAGHHVFIANQLASSQPTIYLGFTAFHALAWALAQLFGGPFEGVRAAFYLTTAGWLSAGALLVGLCVRERSVRGLVGAAVASALLVVVWHRLHLMWAHYYQADGFYAHLQGVLPLCVLLAVWAATPNTRRRLLAAAVVVVLYRFTYALNIGDLLLGLGVLAVTAAHRERAEKPGFWWLVVGVSAVGAAAALWGFWQLGHKLVKPGGVLAPDPLWTLGALAAGAIGAGLIGNRSRRQAGAPNTGPASQRRLGRIVVALVALPLLFVAVFMAFSELPREYYFHKYPFHALVVITTAAPALLGASLAAALVGPPVALPRPKLLGAVLVAALLGGSVVAADRATVVHRQGYLERAGDRPKRQVQALHNPAFERQARAVLARNDAELAVFTHPSWPVFNFTDNVLRAWTPQPPAPVKSLQEVRWRLFLSSQRPEAGQCSFWVDGPAALLDYQAVARLNPTAAVAGVVAEMRGDLRHRCWGAAPGESVQRLCWLCL